MAMTLNEKLQDLEGLVLKLDLLAFRAQFSGRIKLKTVETRCVILLIARARAEVTKREC
jgi:hypothetical protein